MVRRYKPTGGKPGARKGNTNAVRHGVYSQFERAEHLRAHSALRGAKALGEAMRLEADAEALARAEAVQAEEDDRNARWRGIYRDARKLPNFKGMMADVVRSCIATGWLNIFPDEVAPDWVYAWLDALPNIHSSPALQDGDDLTPGIPDAGEEEGGGRVSPETTPPPMHPRSLWNELFPGCTYGEAAEVDGAIVDLLFTLVPQFGSRLHAEAYLKWKMRQFAAHGVAPGEAPALPLTDPRPGAVRRSPLAPFGSGARAANSAD